MTDAVGNSVSVRIRAISTAARRSTSAPPARPSPTRASCAPTSESSDDENAEAEDAERRLPSPGQGPAADRRGAARVGPPHLAAARYTEASLVKALEELGIGRPSTYESIMRTIQDRGYVAKRGQALIPSFLAFAVVGLLEGHYPRLVDYNFTAAMETRLDEIAGGDPRGARLPHLVLLRQPAGRRHTIAKAGGLKKMVTENLSEIDARSVNSIPLFTDDQGRSWWSGSAGTAPTCSVSRRTRPRSRPRTAPRSRTTWRPTS
jgi:DNA topoisomerase-1